MTDRPLWTQQIDRELRVRPLGTGDAEALFRAVDASREHLRRWLPWLDAMRSIDDERAFLAHVEDWHAAGTAMVCGIFTGNDDGDDGEIAGVIGFNAIDRAARHAAIGYWLGGRFTGRGIMTRCCAALLDFAFCEMELDSVDIRAATENLASRSIPERLRFHRGQLIRSAEWLYDHHVDHVYYVLTADVWRRRKQPRAAAAPAIPLPLPVRRNRKRKIASKS